MKKNFEKKKEIEEKSVIINMTGCFGKWVTAYEYKGTDGKQRITVFKSLCFLQQEVKGQGQIGR